MATALPPKVAADIKEGGGRYYRGRGLGTLAGWKCVACGAENAGNFAAGCTACGAGAPGQQVRRPGEPIVKSNPDGRLETAAEGGEARTARAPKLMAATDRPAASPPSRGSGLAVQLRSRAPSVDYDEIERRVLHALDARLGGGYTDAERATLYMALECYTALWEDETIEPTGGLTLEQTRLLMAKVAPESGLEMTGEREEDVTHTQTQTTPGNAHDDSEYDHAAARDPSTDSFDHAGVSSGASAGEPLPVVTRRRQPAAHVAAPQFLDPDLGGDEGGQDDADRDGE